MNTLPNAPAVPPRTSEFALRYGMNDLLCVTSLFGLHMGLGMLIIPTNTMASERTEKVALCAILGGAMAFAAAYLTFRLATARKIEDFGTRLMWLILLDIMLIAVWPVGLVTLEIVGLTSPWLPLLALTFFMGYVTGRANQPKPQRAPMPAPVHPRIVDVEQSESLSGATLENGASSEASRIQR